MEKGHYGEYTGNAKWSKVTNSNMGATKRDDEAHMKYLKEDIDYDNKHGHSDSSMTSDEKHISKLAGDLKYDEKHHGSAAKMVSPLNSEGGIDKHGHIMNAGGGGKISSAERWARHQKGAPHHGGKPGGDKKQGSAAKMVSPLNDKSGKGSQGDHRMTDEAFARHQAKHDRYKDTKARINEKAKMKTQPKLKNK